MNGIILAAMLTLNPGINNVGVAGEVVAIEAATSNAAATVTISAVESLTTYTNITTDVVSYEPAWHVTVTNRGGQAELYLPADCFPVSFEMEGQAHSYTDWSELTLVTGIDPDEYYLRARDSDLSFALFLRSSATGKVVFDTALAGGLTFTPFAQDGRSGVWPELEMSSTTYTTNVVGYLDYSAFCDTNGVSTIVGEPVRFDMPITNTVVKASVAAETYAVTNTIATVTTSAHFGQATTNAYFFGGGLYVTGAGEGDIIRVIYK